MFVGPSDATFRPTINRTSKKLTATLDPLPQRQLSEQRKREDRIAQLSEEVEAERRAQETFTPKLTPAPSHMNLHQRIPLSERTNHVVASTLSASTTAGGGKPNKHNDIPLKVRAAASAHNGATAPTRSSSLTRSKTSLSQERGESYHHHHQEGPPVTTEQQHHFHATRNTKSEALVRQGAREHIEELREERKQAQQLWAQYSDGEHSMTRIGALKAFHALRIPDITESTFAKFQSALGIDEESGAFFVGYDRFQKVIQAVLHAVRQSERQKNDNTDITPHAHAVAKVQSHPPPEQKQQAEGQSNSSQQRSVFLSTRSHESPSPQQQGRQTQQQTTTWEAVSPSSSPQSRASYFRRSPSASFPQTMSHEYDEDHFTSSPQPLARTTSRPMSAGAISSERRTGPQGTSTPSHSARESRTLQQESEKRGVSDRKGSTLSQRHSQAVASASPRAMSADPLKKHHSKMEKDDTTRMSPSTTKARPNVSRNRSASTSHPLQQEQIEEKPSRPQPQIRSRQSQSEATPANVERLSRPLLSQEARTNLLRLRDELQKKEMEQCTFQPDTATLHQGFVRPTAQIHSNSNQSQQHERQRRPPSRHESASVEEKNVLRPSRQPHFFQERAAQFGAMISERNVYESDENQHSDEESTEAYHNPPPQRRQDHLSKESHNQKRSESPQPRHPSHEHDHHPSHQPEGSSASPAAAAVTRSVSVTSTVVSSVLGPAPKGFEKAIERMVEGRKRHVPRFEDSLRHHSSSVAHNDDGSEETSAADAASSTTTCAPFQLRTENRTKEREFSKPLLYIDVDLPNGRSGRIGVHRDDKPEVLARNFCLSYGIAQPETIQRLTDVVQEKVDFVNHQHTRTVWM